MNYENLLATLNVDVGDDLLEYHDSEGASNHHTELIFDESNKSAPGYHENAADCGKFILNPKYSFVLFQPGELTIKNDGEFRPPVTFKCVGYPYPDNKTHSDQYTDWKRYNENYFDNIKKRAPVRTWKQRDEGLDRASIQDYVSIELKTVFLRVNHLESYVKACYPGMCDVSEWSDWPYGECGEPVCIIPTRPFPTIKRHR